MGSTSAKTERRRKERLLEPIPFYVVHNAYTYTNWGCRCETCREENREKRLRDRAARKARLEVEGIPEWATHGTPSTYDIYKCRCEPCRIADNEYQAERRRKKRSGLIPIPSTTKHGTRNAYENWGCRCPDCVRFYYGGKGAA